MTGAITGEVPGEMTGKVRDAVRDVWEQVLKAPVSDDADFFRLGGSSLHAMSICSGLEAKVRVRPRIRVIFDHPRFEDYARQIAALVEGTDDADN